MRWIAIVGIVAVVGCGDDVQPGCDPEVPCGPGTGSGTGDGTGMPGTSTVTATSTSSEPGTSTGGDADGSGSATTDEAGATTDVDTTLGSDGGTGGSTDTGDSTDDGATTGGQGNVEYSAQVLIGALDRILVFKEDLDADRCTWIVLVSPAIGGQLDVTTPKGWDVEQINISDVGDACGSLSPGMFGAEGATSAEGTIALGAIGPTGVYPCDVTVDVTAMFAGIIPGIPPSDVMDAEAIPVTGC